MSERESEAPLRTWLVERPAADVAESIERLRRSEDVRHVAVMPDVHLASEVCVGVAVATQHLIYPAAVGSDIGCGMAAIRFAADADLLGGEKEAAQILSAMYRSIPSIKHPPESVPAHLPESLLARPLSDSQLEKLRDRDGRYQLGTLGRGNHFVELQSDEQDRLWLMVHSGSRGMGQAITAHHLRKARSATSRGQLVALEAESPAGRAYLVDAAWAVAYAEANRVAMVAVIARLLANLFGIKADHDSWVDSNHNHVQQESHFGETYWVHRKGALPAGADVPGVIPGSMGTASFHVVGRGDEASLCSSSHGAGRRLSRGDASRSINSRRLEREMQGVWFDHRRMSLLRDEAPSAYKDIHAVMRAQRDLTRIERQLRPLLSYKGV